MVRAAANESCLKCTFFSCALIRLFHCLICIVCDSIWWFRIWAQVFELKKTSWRILMCGSYERFSYTAGCKGLYQQTNKCKRWTHFVTKQRSISNTLHYSHLSYSYNVEITNTLSHTYHHVLEKSVSHFRV